MSVTLNNFFSENFIPHGHCYLWKPGLVSLHVGSDLAIALAYYSIPVMLFYFVSKRRDVPFPSIFFLFGAFIVSCGTTHLFEVWTLWHPHYWASGFTKVFTALVSLYTAVELFPLIPQALALPSPAELEAANQALEKEILERKQIEQELRRYEDHLQELVEKRTAELAQTNQQLQLEIVERKKSETKLAQLLKEIKSINQELNDFAYIVSHDLKAPLRAISNLTDWLLTDYANCFDEEGKQMTYSLQKKAITLQKLIDSILQYSKVGRTQEQKSKIDLNQLVGEAIEMISPPKNIEVKIVNQLPDIVAEKTRISQLFQNLIGNAVKFIDKSQGKIEIGSKQEGSSTIFLVADNGPGIESKFFDKIFQIFQKLSLDKESDSTGIGLTLVKKIVEMYGGKVWLESVVAQGSTFFFTLPDAFPD